MLSRYLRQFLTTPIPKASKSQVIFWLSLSLAFAAVYSTMWLQQAFSSEYVVQDDARQHVFWMRRFLDPELFPNDLIADYFQSVAPWGYTTLYQLFAAIGIDPILFSKFLPVVLDLVTTGYCFGVCLEILPVPMAGFIASLVLNQNLWCKEDLVSATPRAFIYPLLLAFLYYLLQQDRKRSRLTNSLLPCMAVIALQGLFYPQCVFISVGVLVLQLLRWEHGIVRLSRHRSDYWFCAAGLGVAILVLLPFALTTSQFEPVISVAEAKALPEFWSKGRASFFRDNPWRFWLGGRSGLFPEMPLTPITLGAGLLLPILLRYPSKLPLAKQLSHEAIILIQLSLASIGLFFIAHALLFKLHLPSRYTQHSLQIVLALSAAISLTLMLDALLYWAQQQRQPRLQKRQVLALGTTLLLGIVLALYPSLIKNFPRTQYKVGEVPALYQFFAQQPKDTLIASLAEEADNLPTFSQRSVLVSPEYGIPYHTGYYGQFRQRVIHLIQAQYSPNLAGVQNFIQKYNINFWLLEKQAFEVNYIDKNRWIQQFQPAAAEAQARLEQGITPTLAGLVETCSAFKTEEFLVLSAECIKKQDKANYKIALN